MAYFPVQAEDNIKEVFQYRRERQELEERAIEQRKIQEYVGAPMESITDQIIEELQRPEIETVAIADVATIKETVFPPEIQRLSRDTFFSRLSRGIARFLGLGKR